jgi:hypothetical protein
MGLSALLIVAFPRSEPFSLSEKDIEYLWTADD